MLPPSNMKLDLVRTALVVIDPQVDFLSPKGVAWGAVGESIRPTFKPESSSGT
jgi:nicotinamidase-related amidase